jgi:hypothetical protein
MDALMTQSMLTTTEAGRLLNRTQDAVRNAIRVGALEGHRIDGRWYIDREVLLAWHARARQIDRVGPRPWERVAELLSEHGSASTEEIARLMQVHPGNARKHLAILAAEGPR